jgi:hypothetical protein
MCEQVCKKTLFEQGFYMDGGVLAEVELVVYDHQHRILTSIHRDTTEDGMLTERELLSSRFNDADAIRFAIERLDAM